ncbi:MAG: hypothetical protein ACLVJK_12315 [Alistipes putredinis]
MKKLFTNQTKTFVICEKFNYLFGWLFCGAALLGFGCDDDKTDVPPTVTLMKAAKRSEASSNSVSVIGYAVGRQKRPILRE